MLSDEEKRALGLPLDAEFDDLGALKPKRKGPQGFAGTSSSALGFGARVLGSSLGMTLAIRTERAELSPSFETLELADELQGTLKVSRATGDPGLFRVQVLRGSVQRSGEWLERGDSLFAAPAPGAPGALLVDVDGGLFVLPLRHGEAPRLQRLRRTSNAPSLRVPHLGELLGDLPCADWMSMYYAHDSVAPSDFARAASVGTLARLWSPPAGLRASLLERSSRGEQVFPHERAVAWARENTASLRTAEMDAVSMATELAESLEDLLEWLPADDERRGISLRALAEQRDELESIAYLCAWLGEGEHLREILNRADGAASLHWTLLTAELDLSAESRFVAVRDQEPEAWWGRLAE